jgi:nitrous oxide reductase
MKKQELKQTGRRKFLHSSAVAGAGVAIVATTPASALALTETEHTEKKIQWLPLNGACRCLL